ncbi:MAG: peptidylprolyl isomerase [Proteobacteria bacterium]|nr:peptidylprolyl isomerase [Pseudomonadota bacterium]
MKIYWKTTGMLLALLTLLVACGGETEQQQAEPVAADPPALDSAAALPEQTAMDSVSAEAALVEENQSTPAVENRQQIDKSNPDWKQNLELPALYSFEPGKTYYWEMETSKGPMNFRLFPESAPMHVTSTMFLTEIGFYDDVIFHRVIPGFMAQGGDPTGTGRGGPGYRYNGEFDGTTSHTRRGLLSMANAGPGTDGSQFFITFVPTPFLDGKHTIFGELVSGEETLAALEKVGSRSGATSERVVIETATIRIE